MRRLLRQLVIFGSILSFLLCMATIGSWLRGYREVTASIVQDEIHWPCDPDEVCTATIAHEYGTWFNFAVDGPGLGSFRMAEVEMKREPISAPAQPARMALWVLPLWVIIALAGAPTIWLGFCLRQAWLRADAERMGHCTTCGYDLRASPERCPECGTAVAAAS